MSNLPTNAAPTIDEVIETPTVQDGETYERQAKGADGIARPWNERERYLLFTRGWHDGVAGRPANIGMKGLGAYALGHEQGKAATSAALAAYAEKVGYDVTAGVMRAEEPVVRRG